MGCAKGKNRSTGGAGGVKDARKGDVKDTRGKRQGRINVRDVRKSSARGTRDVKDVRKRDVKDIKGFEGKRGGICAIIRVGDTRWVNARGVGGGGTRLGKSRKRCQYRVRWGVWS
jgi:hypothetical protein